MRTATEGTPRHGGPSGPLLEYDWATLRVVPRVHLGNAAAVAVVLHARTAGFLAMKAITEAAALRPLAPGVDATLLGRYLAACVSLCRGEVPEGCEPTAVVLAPPSERFHWLTAPRSDVLQPSAVHGGLTRDPAATLDRLFLEQVSGNIPAPASPSSS